MKKYLILSCIAVMTLAACNNKENPAEPVPAESTDVLLEPVITRALSLNFNEGDKIGMDIVKSDGTAHVTNALMTYAGTTFSGDVKWYSDGGQTCSISAYYPYQQAGFPESFTVATDQSAGTESSDLMTAWADGVYPTASPVMMKFTHLLSQINIVVDNQASAGIDGITIKGINPTALLTKGQNGAVSAAADPDAAAADIKAEELTAGKNYCVIVVPQTFDKLGVAVDVTGGNTLLSGVEGAELKAGYSYTLTVTVSSDQVDAGLSGDISGWDDGGNLGGGDYETPFAEYADHFDYDGLSYKIVTLSNGTTWMAEPLAYVPLGKTVSDNPASGDIWYPYSSDGTDITVLKDAASIKANGYFYSYDALLGEAVTEENFDKFEGAQGICPKGWHIPTRAEWFALCGYSNASAYLGEKGAQTNDNALFWDSTAGYAPVGKFNEAGFNFTLGGTIANSAYSKLIIDSSVCSVEEYYGNPRMAYLASSSPNKSTQMFALMTTFTSTNNLGKVSLAFATLGKCGVQVRCTKDAQ